MESGIYFTMLYFMELCTHIKILADGTNKKDQYTHINKHVIVSIKIICDVRSNLVAGIYALNTFQKYLAVNTYYHRMVKTKQSILLFFSKF